MKKLFIIIILMTTFCTETTFSCEKTDAAIQYKKYVMQVKRQRMLVYNALNLTEEQFTQKENLFSENNSFYDEEFDRLLTESYKLKTLKEANCPEKDIKEQTKTVNSIKKNIDNRLKAEDKQFKKVLNRNQRTKYSLIKHLERMDANRADKDYHKSNPQLMYFGNDCN